jgi:hypothetical protein
MKKQTTTSKVTTIDSSQPKSAAVIKVEDWMKKKGYEGGALKLHQSYNFVDKVAIIDELRTAWEDSGYTINAVSNRTGVAAHTMKNWFSGKTIRPQYPTLNAVGKLFGMKLKWVKE